MFATPTRRPVRARRVAIASLLTGFTGALAAAACSDGGGGSPAEPAAPLPTLTLSAAPAAVTVQQGQSGAATVTLTRGGHAAVVTLGASVAGSPAGVTATFATASVPAGATETAITLATTAATPPGDHTVTVTGAGGGANAATAVVLRVTPAPAQSYALAVAPSPVAVTAGGAAAATVAIARTNFAGAVTLAVSGAPAGLTIAPPAQPVTDATAALAVQAAASVAAGDYPVTLTGTAAGLAPVTAGFVVRVAAAPGGQPGQPGPGTITGVALDTRGRPIANALVWIRPALHTGLVTARTGADGRYTARGLLTSPPIPYHALAWTEFEYRNRTYCARLASPAPGDYDAFIPTEGVVRDFRWQLSGRIPGGSAIDPSYFGQEVRLFYRLDEALRDDDVFELKLTPQGPLADGSEGQVHTRSIRWDDGSIFEDIPLGVYTVAATWVRDGVRTPLKVNRNGSDDWAPTTTLDWEPASCTGSTAPSMRSFLYLSR